MAVARSLGSFPKAKITSGQSLLIIHSHFIQFGDLFFSLFRILQPFTVLPLGN